jgi:phage gpG-like protein
MIEASKVIEHFEAVERAFMAPLDDVLELCYPVVIQSTRDNFNSQADPDGDDWRPRKIEGDGHPLLQKSGDMMQAATGGGAGHVHEIEHNGDGTDLVVGVNLDTIAYARAQALGYKPRNLPARNYLGLTKAGEEKVAEIIGKSVEQRFDGAAAQPINGVTRNDEAFV